jgi:phosphatidate cytidylyltransferase
MTRVLTAAVAIPLVLLITLYSPQWLFASVVGLAAAAAVEEFLSLASAKRMDRPGKWFLVPAWLVCASFAAGPSWVLISIALAAMALMTATVFGGSIEAGFNRVASGLSSIVYCSVTLGFLILIPRGWIVLLFAIIWVGDSAAYYGGRALGRHLLAPAVSPKKTVEGAIAGLVGSMIAGAIGGIWLLHEPGMRIIGVSAVTAAVGQIGDLAESVLKRSAGVKDSSSILPGHGGILDRLDSLFFATPVFYWILNA